jgi:adenylylsulfate kinase-like enzyme
LQLRPVSYNHKVEFGRGNDTYNYYKLADEGKIKYMPGVDEIYEEHQNADIILNAEENIKNVENIIEFLNKKKIFSFNLHNS